MTNYITEALKRAITLWLIAGMVVGNVQATIIFAVSPEFTHVEEAVNSAAPSGDIVIVPSGTASWTNTLVITKSVYILGAGMGQTVILDDIAATSGNIIKWTTPANTTNWLDGFTFRRGSRTIERGLGTVALWGSSWLVRISNCEFDRTLNRVLYVNGAVYGLMDHCKLQFTEGQTAAFEQSTLYGGTNGDGSWETEVIPGSGEAFYLEDNQIIGKATDAFSGSRMVMRFNVITNTGTTATFGSHGTESSQRKRASRWMEIYGNTVYKSGSALNCFVDFRDGSGLVCSNTLIGNFNNTILLNNYRNFSSFTPWGGADGTNPWDVNYPSAFDSGTATAGASLSLTDSTKSWTVNQWIGYSLRNLTTGRFGLIVANTATTITIKAGHSSNTSYAAGNSYEIRRVDIALDQPGSGRSDPINTASPAWPNQERQPIYQWANTKNGVVFTIGNGPNENIQEGRDFFNGIPNPDWTPLPRPHYLIAMTEGTGGPDPVITSQPQSQTILSGNTAGLSVSATGTTPLSYQWFVGSTGNTGSPIGGATSSTYTTPALTETTAYWCMVSNAVGTANSATATITVTGIPPTIETEPLSQTIAAGQYASLSVGASGTGAFSYQWYLGTSGNTTSPISGATNSIYEPSPSSTTSYWVRVTNAYGTDNSATAVVTVTPTAPPSFIGGGGRNPRIQLRRR